MFPPVPVDCYHPSGLTRKVATFKPESLETLFRIQWKLISGLPGNVPPESAPKGKSPKANTNQSSNKSKWSKDFIFRAQRMLDSQPKGGLDIVGALRRAKYTKGEHDITDADWARYLKVARAESQVDKSAVGQKSTRSKAFIKKSQKMLDAQPIDPDDYRMDNVINTLKKFNAKTKSSVPPFVFLKGEGLVCRYDAKTKISYVKYKGKKEYELSDHTNLSAEISMLAKPCTKEFYKAF